MLQEINLIKHHKIKANHYKHTVSKSLYKPSFENKVMRLQYISIEFISIHVLLMVGRLIENLCIHKIMKNS